MDFFAHFFWTLILFYRSKYLKYMLVVGILPDLLSWGIYILARVSNGAQVSEPILSEISNWVFTLYGLTHSVVIFILVFATVYILFRKYAIILLPWLIHIAMDIPTHSREFFPTPFLWPLSSWMFPGISWGTQWFMITNYTIIITLLLLTIIYKKNIITLFRNLFKKT